MKRMYPVTAIRRESGFSLIEAMVSLTIGLILLGIMSAVFVSNGTYRNDLDRSSRLIENGSYALERLGSDVMMAGFYAELDVGGMMGRNPTAAIATAPDPCVTTLAGLRAGMPFAVQGYAAPDAATVPTVPAGCATLLADAKAGSDILVVRHVDPCAPGEAADVGVPACDAVAAGRPYLQVTHCHNEIDTSGTGINFNATTGVTCDLGSNYTPARANLWCILDTDTSAAHMNLHEIGPACSTAGVLAPIHRYYVDIWFVANNDKPSDGIPTLKVAQLDRNAAGTAPAFSVIPIAEGMETMQLEYGLGYTSPSTQSGNPQAYTADPDTYADATHSHCTGVVTACPANWGEVMAVKIHLLGRNTEATPRGYTNDKTFTLGLQADGATAATYTYNDNFKRHVYESTVRVRNPSDRRL